MKKCTVLVLAVLLLTGCSTPPDEMKTGMELRSKLLQASVCSFDTQITADYGNKVHHFSMKCLADGDGTIDFTVTAPESISGITGKLSSDCGQLTFDDTALHFELLAEEQLSPVSAPWILLKTLRSGYIASVGRDEGQIRLSIDDSFKDDPLRLDIWLNPDNQPQQADILYDGRRILSISVENFEIL